MAGFGVGPGELQGVAKQYEDHGADITQLKSTVTPSVGAGQVGRKFRGTETKYKSYFDRLQASMETFGREATNVALRLKDVAKTYESNESATSDQFRG
ncbi:WXG100 family type VII secretion target [Actinosynnema sp. NPDC059797]